MNVKFIQKKVDSNVNLFCFVHNHRLRQEN